MGRVQKPHVRNKSNLSYWIVNTMYLTPHILFVVIVKNFCCVIVAWGGIMKEVLWFLSLVFLCLHIYLYPTTPCLPNPFQITGLWKKLKQFKIHNVLITCFHKSWIDYLLIVVIIDFFDENNSNISIFYLF